MNVNNMDLKFPNQLFINNEFVDASNGDTFNTINPHDGSVSANVLFRRIEIKGGYLISYVLAYVCPCVLQSAYGLCVARILWYGTASFSNVTYT